MVHVCTNITRVFLLFFEYTYTSLLMVAYLQHLAGTLFFLIYCMYTFHCKLGKVTILRQTYLSVSLLEDNTVQEVETKKLGVFVS